MKGLCVYPGSFDPPTIGHLDLIERGACIFPELIVAVLQNPAKKNAFTVVQRMDMLRRACAHLPNVRIDAFGGLLVDYLRKTGAETVLRGVRTVNDFETEFQMAQINRQLFPKVETLLLPASPEEGFISSSAVREIAHFGGDITPFVPAEILEDIKAGLNAD